MVNLLLIVLILGPLALYLLFKSNAALSFLALCAGVVVVSYGGNDINSAIKAVGLGPYSTSAVELVLIIAPLALTLIVTKKTVASRSKAYFQGVTALCAGGLLALSTVPLLTETMQTSFANSQIWLNLQKIQAAVVGVGVLCALVLTWSKSLKKSKSKKH